jgi:cytochrome P450
VPLVRSLLNRLRPGSGQTAAPPPPPAAAGWTFDPLDPGFLADPYPGYARLRAHGRPWRTDAGTFALARYGAVVEGLANPLLGNAPSPYAVTNPRNRARYVCADLANNILPFLDSPRHDLPRKIVAQVFHAQLRQHPLDLAGTADDYAARLAEGEPVDLLDAYATPLSLAVVCDLIGIPRADGPLLRTYSEYFFYLFTRIPSVAVREEIDARLTSFRAYFTQLVEAHRAAPRPDLISALLAAWDAEAGLAPAQLVDTLILLFADAVENVDRCIATAVALTLRHPEVHARLAADNGLIGKVVGEVLRYDSPAQHIARIARDDLEIGGVAVPRDSVVLLLLGSANRDPDEFPEPDRFDIDRGKNTYLSFGKGKHSCIGGTLVRWETEAALLALVRRFPDMRLADAPLQFMARPGHRWLSRLDVTP